MNFFIFLEKCKKTLEICEKMVYNKMNLVCVKICANIKYDIFSNGGLQKW